MLKTEQDRQKYNMFLEEKNKILSDPNADLLDLMRVTRGSPSMTDAPMKQVRQFESVIQSLS
jgi:hypothetical protein